MMFTLSPGVVAEGYGDAILSLDVCKSHLRVDGEDEDDLITAFRDASIDMVEQYANLRMGPVTGIEATFDVFCDRMRVGVGPAHRFVVTGVGYVGSDGVDTVIADGGWRVDPSGGLRPNWHTLWPYGGRGVSVTFNAGYTEGECPKALIAAAQLFLGHLYANREAVMAGSGLSGELPLAFIALCDRYRMPVI